VWLRALTPFVAPNSSVDNPLALIPEIQGDDQNVMAQETRLDWLDANQSGGLNAKVAKRSFAAPRCVPEKRGPSAAASAHEPSPPRSLARSPIGHDASTRHPTISSITPDALG